MSSGDDCNFFINNGVMAYTCDHCERVFSDKTELLLHVETINDEKPYQCADCDKSFANNNNFKIHLTTHNAKESNTRDSKDASEKINTPLTDSYTQSGYKDCDKNSRRHIPTHTSVKKHKCKYCDKAFSDSSNLNRHMKTHSSEKSHKCKYCDKTFSDSSNLNRHN